MWGYTAKLKLSQVKIKERVEKKGSRQSLDYNLVCKQLKNKEFLIEYDKNKKEFIKVKGSWKRKLWFN